MSKERLFLREKFKTRVFESLVLNTPRSHPYDFEQFVLNIYDKDSFPIVMATHKAHTAGFPVMQEVNYLRSFLNPQLPPESQLHGSLLLVAGNISTGQTDTVTEYHRIVQPILQDLEVKELPIVRPGDEITGEKDSIAGLKIVQGLRLSKGVINGSVFISFPEGTVKSGRQKEGGRPGEINGMVELKSGSIEYLTEIVRRRGKKPVIFFIGNTGENRIYDPITSKITREAKLKGVSNLIFRRRVGDPIMTTVVDYPTTLCDIEEAIGKNGHIADGLLEQYCGERLAQLLPNHERGYYSDPYLLDGNHRIKRRVLRFPNAE